MAAPRDDRLEAGPIVVDRVTRRMTVHGRALLLPAKEYDLVAKLATEPERVFTKEQLLREVWGYRSLGSKRRLRRWWCLDATRGASGQPARSYASGRRPGVARAKEPATARASRGRSD